MGQGQPVGPVHSKAAVLGHPIAHSLSPVLHRAAYEHLGLTGWSYDVVDCTQEALAGFFAGMDPQWAGLSLTMPLKKAVIPLLEAVSPLAVAVGAVNTVTFPGGRAPAGAVGDNTDVYGLLAAVSETGLRGVQRAVVLGGGATASSSLAALRDLGCPTPYLCVRAVERAQDTLEAAARLGVRPRLLPFDRALSVLGDADLVISTVPIQASGALADDLRRLPATALPMLLDVVYAPWPTPLAQAWSAGGGAVVGGLAMLVHQAVEQVRLMTGTPGPLEAMRAAGEAELARRATARGTPPIGATPRG